MGIDLPNTFKGRVLYFPVPQEKPRRYLLQAFFRRFEKDKRVAYYIWLNKGKPASSATGDWLQAEKELKKEGLI